MSTANQSMRAVGPPRTSARSSSLGPTASGKSGLSIDLAERLMAEGRPAEIVNADSMLVYRGMDIGTAKPTVAERARVVHHLVDVLDVTETATVAEFQRRARAAIADCHARQVLPIVVGGSALYIRAIVDEFDFPGTDAAVRDPGGNGELASIGPEALHARLADRGPGRCGGDPAGQRPSHRPRAGGHRADRATVRGPTAGAALPAARRGPDRAGDRPVRPGPTDRAAGRGDVGRRAGHGGVRARPPGSAGRC